MIVVRDAALSDLPAVLPMMRALKDQHGDPQRDTAASLEQAFIGPARLGMLLVAEREGAACGYATAFHTYETGHAQRGAYVGDLFVAPERRRQGVGQALLAGVAARVRATGGSFLWWVAQPGNGAAHAFYRRLIDIEDPLRAFAVTSEGFLRLAEAG